MTPFDEVHDLALISFKDYKINKLYGIDPERFRDLLQGYLIKAIPNFTNCKKDLEQVDLTNRTFLVDLDLKEKTILSNLEVIEWMNSQILDVTQMSLTLNDTDFKTFSQAQNLKAKQDAQNALREIVDQQLVNYGLKNIPWAEWASGNYDL